MAVSEVRDIVMAAFQPALLPFENSAREQLAGSDNLTVPCSGYSLMLQDMAGMQFPCRFFPQAKKFAKWHHDSLLGLLLPQPPRSRTLKLHNAGMAKHLGTEPMMSTSCR